MKSKLAKYHHSELTEPHLKEALKLLRRKKSLPLVRDTTGVSLHILSNIGKANNILIQPPKVKKHSVYKALRMLKDGKTDSFILDKLGISRQRLHQIKIQAKKYKLI
jgi:hypothetical protein